MRNYNEAAKGSSHKVEDEQLAKIEEEKEVAAAAANFHGSVFTRPTTIPSDLFEESTLAARRRV